VADRKAYGSVPECRKRMYNVNSNDHRSTKFELLLYKEVETMRGGDSEQHEMLVLKKGLLLASAWSSEVRMTRTSAGGHQKAATMAMCVCVCVCVCGGAYWKRRRVQCTLCIQLPNPALQHSPQIP